MPSPANGPAKPARPIRIKNLQVSDARISITDLSRKQAFMTTIGPLSFELIGFRHRGPIATHAVPF